MKNKNYYPDLKLQIQEDYSNDQYIINLNFDGSLFITATNVSCFPKKVYTGSFSLSDLKKRNKFFRIYDSMLEAYDDLNSLIKQNAFFIKNLNQIISLCIEKQVGFQNDIIFPLKEEEANVNEIVYELCEKYINLEKRVEYLEKRQGILRRQKKENINKYNLYKESNSFSKIKALNGYGYANIK